MITGKRFAQRIADVPPHGPDNTALHRLNAHLIAGYDAHLAKAVLESGNPEAALRAEGFVWLADALFGKPGEHLDGDGTAAAG